MIVQGSRSEPEELLEPLLVLHVLCHDILSHDVVEQSSSERIPLKLHSSVDSIDIGAGAHIIKIVLQWKHSLFEFADFCASAIVDLLEEGEHVLGCRHFWCGCGRWVEKIEQTIGDGAVSRGHDGHQAELYCERCHSLVNCWFKISCFYLITILSNHLLK